MNSKKHVFWQAFLLSVLIFILGIVVGIYFEQLRSDNSNILFYESESSLFDTLAFSDLLSSGNLSCDEMILAHIAFADDIFEDAKTVSELDSSNKMTHSLRAIHKKYDLLRTILWVNAIKLRENCPQVNNVVYIYNLDEEDLDKRAKQGTFSKILTELKENNGDRILLIPIAADQDISSLNFLIENYEIEDFPAIIINEKHKIYDLQNPDELEQYLE